MNVPRLSWRPARWALLRPLSTGAPDQVRQVVELRLQRAGRTGLGEAAPLPGLHRETVEDVVSHLRRLSMHLRQQPPASSPVAAARQLGLALPPSLGWALDWAWHDLTEPEPALPAPPSAGLLLEPPESWHAAVAAAPDCRCWKLKIGRHDPLAEARAFRGLARDFPRHEWRLDANRAFPLAEARAFQAAAAPARPRWIEEPLASVAQLADWLAGGGWPLALDESLREALPAGLAERAAAWVLKPQLLGLATVEESFERVRRLAAAGGSAPCCVISACFESPLGLRALEQLAARAPGRPAPGLGTRAWLGARLDELDWEDGA